MAAVVNRMLLYVTRVTWKPSLSLPGVGTQHSVALSTLSLQDSAVLFSPQETMQWPLSVHPGSGVQWESQTQGGGYLWDRGSEGPHPEQLARSGWVGGSLTVEMLHFMDKGLKSACELVARDGQVPPRTTPRLPPSLPPCLPQLRTWAPGAEAERLCATLPPSSQTGCCGVPVSARVVGERQQ